MLFYFFNKSLKEMFTFLVHNCRRWPDISFNQTFIKRIIFVLLFFFLFDWYKCFHHAHKFDLNWRNVPRTPLSFSVQIVKDYCNKRDLFLTPQTVYQCPAGLLNITSSSNCLATRCTFPNSNHVVPWFYALLRILFSIRKKAEEIRWRFG